MASATWLASSGGPIALFTPVPPKISVSLNTGRSFSPEPSVAKSSCKSWLSCGANVDIRPQRGSCAEANAARTRDFVLHVVELVSLANKSFHRLWDLTDPRASFDSEVPDIPLVDYGTQLVAANRRSRTVWLIMLTFLHRVSTYGKLPITAHNAHRLVLCSLLLAIKCVSDRTGDIHAVQLVAQAGGVSCAELREMECAFLNLVSWRLHFQLDDLTTLAESLLDIEAAALSALQAAQHGALWRPVLPIPELRAHGDLHQGPPMPAPTAVAPRPPLPPSRSRGRFVWSKQHLRATHGPGAVHGKHVPDQTQVTRSPPRALREPGASAPATPDDPARSRALSLEAIASSRTPSIPTATATERRQRARTVMVR